MKTLAVAALFVVLLAAWTLGAQTPKPNELVRIGSISAENGDFSILDNLITAYSDRDISVEYGTGDKRDFLTTEGGAVSFRVKGEIMQSAAENAPEGAAESFAFCDADDQVSIPVEGAIRAMLPKGAKVKETEDLDDGRLLIAYSTPGIEHYKLFLALLKGKPGTRYRVVGSGFVSEYGFYCGQLAITKNIRAVLVNEPSGSSDSSSVYLFAIKEENPAKDN
ncbi:MAG: hypothetical protein WBP85_14530 [Terracidiphilus sp.]